MHDVDGAAGEAADEDRAVDRLLLGPVGARRRKVRRLRPPLGDRLVLEVAEDVAVLGVDLAHAVEGGDALHGLAEELVGDHALAALLVGHEHLERAHAEPHRLRQPVEDRRLVLEDEVKAEVEAGVGLGLFAQPARRLWQCLARRVVHERHDGGEPGAGGSLRRDFPVVVIRPDVQVAVDQPREDELARRVDHAVGGRQELLGRQRDDAPVLDRHGGVQRVSRRDHATALDDEIDAARCHGSGLREAGSGRGWPDRDGRGVDCSGLREAGSGRGWPDRDGRGVIGSAPSRSRVKAACRSAAAGAGRGSSSACAPASSDPGRCARTPARRRSSSPWQRSGRGG